MRNVARCDYCGSYSSMEDYITPAKGWLTVYGERNEHIELDFCSSACIANWAVMIYNNDTIEARKKEEQLEHATPW